MPIRNGIAKGRNNEKRLRAIALWLKGLTYSEIGKSLNVSRQRAQQMIAPPRPIWVAVRVRAKGKCQQCGVEILNGHIHHKNATNRTLEDFNDFVNLVYLCPGCHRTAHRDPDRIDPETGKPFKTISMRPTPADWELIEALKVKRGATAAKVVRMALRRLAEADNLKVVG
jgi:5-methylcytosine-specific restriction endonuclease McrA